MKNISTDGQTLEDIMDYLHERIGCGPIENQDYCFQQLTAFQQIQQTLRNHISRQISSEEAEQLILDICNYGELASNHAFRAGFKEGVRLVNELNRI